MNRNDSGWSMMGSIIGLLILGYIAVTLMRHLATALGGLFLIVVVAGLSLSVVATGGLTAGRRAPKGGGARFATLAELVLAGWLFSSGWPLGTRRTFGGLWHPRIYLPPTRMSEHILCFAATRQGKTSRVLVPIILSEADQPPERQHALFIFDPVGELYRLTGGYLARHGYDVHVWSPSDPAMTTTLFDPLAYIPPPSDPSFTRWCETIARVLMSATHRGDDNDVGFDTHGDPYWPKQASNLVKAVLLMLKATEPEATILDLAAYFLDTSAEEIQEELENAPNRMARARARIIADALRHEKIAAAVYTDVRERFMVFGDPQVKAVTGRPSLPIAAAIERPTAIFVQIAATDTQYQPLLSMVLATATHELLKLTDQGRPLPRGARILADEVPTLGRVYGLGNGLNTLGKYGIGFFLSTQATDQLRTIYTPSGAQPIIDGCVHKLCLGGAADRDAEWISKRLGRCYEYLTVPGRGPGGQAHTSYQRHERPLMAPDDIITMDEQLIVSTSKIRPLLLEMRPYYDVPRWRNSI